MAERARLPATCWRAVRRRGFAYVSLASAWEVAIETSLGRLRPAAPFGSTVEASGFAFLPLLMAHVEEVPALPSTIPIHSIACWSRRPGRGPHADHRRPELAAYGVRRFVGLTLINLLATRMFWRDGAGTAAKARQAA